MATISTLVVSQLKFRDPTWCNEIAIKSFSRRWEQSWTSFRDSKRGSRDANQLFRNIMKLTKLVAISSHNFFNLKMWKHSNNPNQKTRSTADWTFIFFSVRWNLFQRDSFGSPYNNVIIFFSWNCKKLKFSLDILVAGCCINKKELEKNEKNHQEYRVSSPPTKPFSLELSYIFWYECLCVKSFKFRSLNKIQSSLLYIFWYWTRCSSWWFWYL